MLCHKKYQNFPRILFFFYPDSTFRLPGFQQKEPTLVPGMHRSKSKHELKLLEKIPENAEATVVLVGELLRS